MQGVAQGEAGGSVERRQVQALQQAMHRLVIQGDGPAGIGPGQGRRVIPGHLQQGDGHPLGQVLVGVVQPAEGPLRVQGGAAEEGKFRVLLGIEDAEVRQPRTPSAAIRSRMSVRTMPASTSPRGHRLDHGVVDAAEAQVQIAPRVDAVDGQFPPGHLEAAERGLIHRHQGPPAQPLQGRDVGSVGAGEDDPAEDIALALPHPVAQGGDARDPVADLQVD